MFCIIQAFVLVTAETHKYSSCLSTWFFNPEPHSRPTFGSLVSSIIKPMLWNTLCYLFILSAFCNFCDVVNRSGWKSNPFLIAWTLWPITRYLASHDSLLLTQQIIDMFLAALSVRGMQSCAWGSHWYIGWWPVFSVVAWSGIVSLLILTQFYKSACEAESSKKNALLSIDSPAVRRYPYMTIWH